MLMIGVVSTATMSSIQMSSNAKIRTEYYQEIETTTREIISLFSSGTICAENVLGKTLPSSLSTIKAKGVERFTLNKKYGSSGLQIQSIEINNTESEVAGISDEFMMKIVYLAKKNASKSNVIKKIKFHVSYLNGAISSCRSLSSFASDVWNQNSNGDIYYNGNVGIGNDQPKATLDVNGGIKLGDQNTVSTCTSENEGTMRYNKNNHTPEICQLNQESGTYTFNTLGGSTITGKYCVLRNGSCPTGFNPYEAWFYDGPHQHDICSTSNLPGSMYATDIDSSWTGKKCKLHWTFCCN